jgi:hypothetical protein
MFLHTLMLLSRMLAMLCQTYQNESGSMISFWSNSSKRNRVLITPAVKCHSEQPYFLVDDLTWA